MTFQCEKCEKIFARELYFIRHTNRKIPCNRNLSCTRCGKNFKSMGNLNQHLNKLNKCDNDKEILMLELQIEKEKTKQKDKELKIEEAKIKQAKLTNNQKAGRDINNININNIQNINNYIQIGNRYKKYVDNIPVPNNIVETIYNLCKDQYNNPDNPENKCILFNKGKLYALDDDKLINYNEFKPKLQKHIKDNCDDIIQTNKKLTYDEMVMFNIPQRDFIEDDKISILKKVPRYVNNTRNNGVLKKQLKRAII